MAKQRYIDTKFWDDKYIRSLQPNGKLLFLYLITNALTTIAGAYEISEDRMVFDTGLTETEIMAWLEKLETDDKVTYREGWMFVRNTIKHQVTRSQTVRTGIETVLGACPQWIKDRVSIPYEGVLNLNLNLDLNPDLDKNGGSRPTQPEAADLPQKETADPEWGNGLTLLAKSGLNKTQARPLLGRLARDYGKELLATCIAATNDENPADPKSFLIGTLRHRSLPVNGTGQKTVRNTSVEEAWLPPDAPPSRPPADVTKKEAAVWSTILEYLRKRVNKDVFSTWFRPVIFDGIDFSDDTHGLIRLRAGQITRDWIDLYYSELLTEAVATLGEVELSVDWEVEAGAVAVQDSG